MLSFHHVGKQIGADGVRFRWPLIVAGVLALLARAQGIATPMYSVDGWGGWDPGDYPLFFEEGRFGFVLAQWLLRRVGYAGMDVVPSALVLSTVLLIGAGFVYARVLFDKPDAIEVFVFTSLFALHPFNTEFYTFSDVTLIIMLAIFLAAVGLACANAGSRTWIGPAVGGLLLVLSASIYQTAFVDSAVVSLLCLVGRIPASGAATTGLRLPLRYASIPQVRAFLGLTAAALAYVACTFASRPLLGFTLSDRFANALGAGVSNRLQILVASVRYALKPPSGIVPGLASAILVAVLLVAAAAIVRALLRRGVAHFVLGVFSLLASGAFAVSLCAVEQFAGLTPRELSPFSIWVAGVAALGWHSVRTEAVRYGLGFALAVLLLSFVGSSNRILYDQRRVNSWDRQQANRILTRLEADPHFRDIHALALVNGDRRYGAELSTVVGDMNSSAFAIEWSKLPMMEQTTGLRFGGPTDAEAEYARTYCRAASVWPSGESAVVHDGLAIICLPKPR